ncbi:MAG: cold-shock protein [Bacilli bacterium]|nr:cold-shock protein [Bacilli bacterium]
MIGRVKWFNNTTGYGFIQSKDGQDIFIHYSNILQDGFKTLETDQLVEFQLLETSKGLQALNIRAIDKSIQ